MRISLSILFVSFAWLATALLSGCGSADTDDLLGSSSSSIEYTYDSHEGGNDHLFICKFDQASQLCSRIRISSVGIYGCHSPEEEHIAPGTSGERFKVSDCSAPKSSRANNVRMNKLTGSYCWKYNEMWSVDLHMELDDGSVESISADQILLGSCPRY